jgi:hypothetical protein
MKAKRWMTTCTVGLSLLAACGCGSSGASAKANAAANAPYCDEARRWAIHELDSYDQNDPKQLRDYWGEYMAFVHNARRLAPVSIRGDWNLRIEGDTLTPVLEKYQFDYPLIEKTATDAEKATFDPPEDIQRAQNLIAGYESDICGAQQPLAADVSFAAEKKGAYCDVAAAEDDGSSKVFAAGTKPADVKSLIAAESKWDAKLLTAAPSAIKADVRAIGQWNETRKRDVLARYHWDIRKLVLDGSPRDRADLQSSDDRIRTHVARVRAYQDQVCSQQADGGRS